MFLYIDWTNFFNLSNSGCPGQLRSLVVALLFISVLSIMSNHECFYSVLDHQVPEQTAVGCGIASSS